VVDHDWG
jgi:hypothetical protein